MNPFYSLLMLQGLYYLTNKDKKKRHKHHTHHKYSSTNFECVNDWECDECWKTDCEYFDIANDDKD